MKIFTIIFIILLSFSQLGIAQDYVQPQKKNVMSGVFGITGEGGITLGYTDYSTKKINYTGKASLEYYLPSTGQGNFGVRIFGQTGFIAGKDAPVQSGNATNEFSTKVDMYGGGAFYTLSIGDAIYPWIGFGISNLWFYPKDGNGDKLQGYNAKVYNTHMLGYNGDAGVRIMVSKSMSFNFAAGLVVGSKDFLDDIQIGSHNDLFYTLTAGVSYNFGREKDDDSDGVSNLEDRCPNTPIGIEVDEFGCPLDIDKDGVPDYLDKCSNTPKNVKVDINGCPLDTDKDGVPDYLDKCSDTPENVKVDINGCPLDSDKDNVPDYLDKCPNTPHGVEVDKNGCEVKPAIQDTVLIVQPVEIESIVLSGDANFEFSKAKLLPGARTALEPLVATMKNHPNYIWEIGGYTDGVGSASYNKKLSKERANAVVDYLISRDVKRDCLKVVGYGKDNPIATNDTVEGRSMNRRVEIKVLTKDTK